MSETAYNKTAYYDAEQLDSLYNITGLSVRTFNALIRAGINTVSEVMEMTDHELRGIRNLGRKSIAEINSLFSGRNRTYEGEAEYWEARRMWNKLDITASKILRSLKKSKMTLAEFMASDTNIEGRARARQILTEYCVVFPERIKDIIKHFETAQDTSDKLYIILKLAHDREQAVIQGRAERIYSAFFYSNEETE